MKEYTKYPIKYEKTFDLIKNYGNIYKIIMTYHKTSKWLK